MSGQLTPSKRLREASGKGKSENCSVPTLRLLCPVSKVDGVVGKDGEGILCVERETGVSVCVEDGVSGCDERVIVITASGKRGGVGEEEEKKEEGDVDGGLGEEQEKKEDGDVDGGVGDEEKREDGGVDGGVGDEEKKEDMDVDGRESNEDDGAKESCENDGDKDEGILKTDEVKEGSVVEGEEGKDDTVGKRAERKDVKAKETGPDEDSELEKGAVRGNGASSVRQALLLVFHRMVEGKSEEYGEDKDSSETSVIAFRILILSSQVGCLLGRGGSVIKQISSESGAQIRIFPRDKLPSCSPASHELVQITGGVDKVRKALESISNLLSGNPFRARDSSNAQLSGPSAHSYGHQSRTRPEPYHAKPRQTAEFDSDFPSKVPKFYDDGHMAPMPEMLSFRVLCPSENVGGVIGKWGAIVKTIQQETGCDIRVLDDAADSEDRIILISGPVHPDDIISAAQDAVLRVQARIMRAIPDSKEKAMMARLLVPSKQIGCLLGKGGAIIGEMRKKSGASIRVMGKDQIPKCASENEVLVQVSGELEAVQEALVLITTKLRNHLFRDHGLPLLNYPPAFPDHGIPFGKFMGRREVSPPGMYSSLRPFQKFDAAHGPARHGGHHFHDDFPPFMHKSGIPSHLSERIPWGAQGAYEGGAPSGLLEFAGGPQRRLPGFGGASQPAIITSTTVEVVVPRAVVPAIYGEDGGCLKQIRQISDAKVEINEPEPGAAETVIIISGTPEQTNAAQSLIQAFVMSETESA